MTSKLLLSLWQIKLRVNVFHDFSANVCGITDCEKQIDTGTQYIVFDKPFLDRSRPMSC